MRLGRLSSNAHECALIKIPACNECPSSHLDLPLYDERVVPKGSEFNEWNACASSSGSSSFGEWYLDVLPIGSPNNQWVCVLPLKETSDFSSSSSSVSSSSSSSSSSGMGAGGYDDCICIRYQDYDPNIHKICGDIYPSEYDCRLRRCRSDNVMVLGFDGEEIVNAAMDNLPVDSYDGCNAIQSKVGGASGYFNGSSYLDPRGELSLGSEDFNVGLWFRLDGEQEAYLIDYRRQGDADTHDKPYLHISYGSSSSSGSTINWSVNGSSLISAPAPSAKRWHRLSLIRESGLTRMLMDGLQVGSSSYDPTKYVGSPTLFGSTFGGSHGLLRGYVDDFSISTNKSTLALLRFEGDFSNESGSGLQFQTRGNASTTQSQKKMGSYSAHFDGSSSAYALLPEQSFGNRDFTVEMWFRASTPGAGGQYATLASCRPHGFSIYYNHDGAGQGRIGFSTDYFQIASQRSFMDSRWHHVAAVRHGDTFSLYVDGRLEASADAPGAVINR